MEAFFLEKDVDNNVRIDLPGDGILQYKVINVLEFSSARKRMSIILQDLSNGKYFLMTKGADSVLLPRLNRDINVNMI